MAVPSNFVATTDNPIDPDQFNTYVQTVASVDTLRGFIGSPVMVIELQGTVSVGDGGQGNFYWNAAGTAPDDDGVTTVTPAGSNPGQWTRIPSALTGIVNLTNAINFADAGNITAAATTDIGSAAGNYATITGNTTITAFGTATDGAWRRVRFTGTPTLTYNATSLILPTAANIIVAAGDTADLVSLGSGNWVVTNYQRFSGQALSTPTAAITTVSVQTFTGSGTYTRPPGLVSADVEMCAGGGGGGSIAAAATAGAGGGGSGGQLKALLTAAQLGATQTVTISGGGAGGATGGSNTGSAGGNVSLGSLLSCTGGAGGGGAGSQVSGGTGGTATVTVGTTKLAATGGTGGVGGFNTIAIGGNGADSIFGQGGGQGLATGAGAVNGLPGNGYGAGGAGACSASASTTQPGGNGSPGIIIITEYISV